MESHSEDNLRRVVVTIREQELQKLLSEERVRSEQRKNNYSTLKEEHLKLQKDFLTLQSEMRIILEETKFIKDKKDNELQNLFKLIEEKDNLIDKLNLELKQTDPQLIKETFAEELNQPIKKLQKDKELLIRDKERMAYELKIAKQKIDYLEKENIDAIERVKLTFEAEMNLIKREKEELRIKLIEANQSPDVKRLTDLAQENARLNARIKAFQTTLGDTEVQYKKIQTKVESLVIEHENSEKEYEKQISALNSQLNQLRENNANLRQLNNINTRDKEELNAEIDRLKNELSRTLKEFEEREKYFSAEKEKIKRLSLKDLKEIEDEKDIICDEFKSELNLVYRVLEEFCFKFFSLI
jgi:coiled-coil domain-containing protein 41